ncbi:uncharacterized protein LOC123554278 [Mercenaria mercenaria]|uniref:uncharacterized protein LOC123554278 n=1 Tax=Mercenaria mercenaria TaxID=6596 RepID=UPI00234F7251|nr:uncharacterized protein LOC123554278 [Mercenaria mercenaria]
MKQMVIMVFMSLCLGTAYGRLTAEEMRATLKSLNPLFSHARGSAVPFRQNVNVRLPVSEAAVQTANDRISIESPMASEARTNELPSNARPVSSAARTNKLPSNARPVTSEARTNDRPSNVRPMTSEARTGGLGSPVQQKRRVVPVPAGKPRRQQDNMLGQIKPAPVAQQPVQAPVNAPAKNQQSRPASQPSTNNIRPAANVASAEQQVAASKQECAFHIPSFLLPDPHPSSIGSSQSCPSFLLPGPSINRELVTLMVEHLTGIKKSSNPQLNGVKSQITQVEFEQKCLIPALRAHVLGGQACKTRELKVYLEWLLYLRQRLFNI